METLSGVPTHLQKGSAVGLLLNRAVEPSREPGLGLRVEFLTGAGQESRLGCFIAPESLGPFPTHLNRPPPNTLEAFFPAPVTSSSFPMFLVSNPSVSWRESSKKAGTPLLCSLLSMWHWYLTPGKYSDVSLLGVGAEGVWFLRANLAHPASKVRSPSFPLRSSSQHMLVGNFKFFSGHFGWQYRWKGNHPKANNTCNKAAFSTPCSQAPATGLKLSWK